MTDQQNPPQSLTLAQLINLATTTAGMYSSAFGGAIDAWQISGGAAARDFDMFARILGERLQVHAGVAAEAAQRATAAGNIAEANYWQNIANTSQNLANPGEFNREVQAFGS